MKFFWDPPGRWSRSDWFHEIQLQARTGPASVKQSGSWQYDFQSTDLWGYEGEGAPDNVIKAQRCQECKLFRKWVQIPPSPYIGYIKTYVNMCSVLLFSAKSICKFISALNLHEMSFLKKLPPSKGREGCVFKAGSSDKIVHLFLKWYREYSLRVFARWGIRKKSS